MRSSLGKIIQSLAMEEPEYQRAGRIVYDLDPKSGLKTSGYSLVKFRVRIITWASVVALALIATVPDPRAFYLIPLYPHGFDRAIGTSGSSGGGVVGYLVHTALLVFILAAGRRSLYFVATLTLVVVCSINTRGCHQILSGLAIDG